MHKPFSCAVVLTFLICAIWPRASSGQSSLPRIAVGGKVSTLGIGVEGATAVTARSNVRYGFNFFNYDRVFHKRGITYDGQLELRSLQITYDQYLFSGFHVSPGLLAYNGTKIDATASVPAGQSFSLGGATYFSGQTNPINGTADMTVRKSAPMVLFGFGNVLPRSGRHLGFNVDTGVVFQGSPTTTLNLGGNACFVSPTIGCVNAATDPNVQNSVHAEQAKLNGDLEPFKYYPVLSFEVSWKW
jgi:hypothetical protein